MLTNCDLSESFTDTSVYRSFYYEDATLNIPKLTQGEEVVQLTSLTFDNGNFLIGFVDPVCGETIEVDSLPNKDYHAQSANLKGLKLELGMHIKFPHPCGIDKDTYLIESREVRFHIDMLQPDGTPFPVYGTKEDDGNGEKPDEESTNKAFLKFMERQGLYATQEAAIAQLPRDIIIEVDGGCSWTSSEYDDEGFSVKSAIDAIDASGHSKHRAILLQRFKPSSSLTVPAIMAMLRSLSEECGFDFRNKCFNGETEEQIESELDYWIKTKAINKELNNRLPNAIVFETGAHFWDGAMYEILYCASLVSISYDAHGNIFRKTIMLHKER